MESDVVPLLPEGTPVWFRADNAYYGEPFMTLCRRREWDCSVSVTDATYKAPGLEQLEGLRASAWEAIGLCERTTLGRHRPRTKKHTQAASAHSKKPTPRQAAGKTG